MAPESKDSEKNLKKRKYLRQEGLRLWFSWKCCDIFVAKPKTMNSKTSKGETPVFVNLLSDMGFKAVYADPANKSLH